MNHQVIFKYIAMYFQYMYFCQGLAGFTYWPWNIYPSATDTQVARITDTAIDVQIQ